MGFKGSLRTIVSARATPDTMPNRRIQDHLGTTWDVWDVSPGDVRAGSYDRRTGDRLRVPTPESTLSVQPELENGWLCFQAANERRRYAPVPDGWFAFPDDALRRLLEIATPVVSSKDIRTKPLTAE